jgi:hypothetical protein
MNDFIEIKRGMSKGGNPANSGSPTFHLVIQRFVKEER